MIMTMALDSHSASMQEETTLCYYVNRTSKVQVVRISNIANWYFERVVFPGQRLIFEAYPSGQLEVYNGAMASAVLADSIACDRLQLNTTEERMPSQVG